MSEELTIFLGLVIFSLVAFAFITGSWLPILWLVIVFVGVASALDVAGGGRGK